jgi:hypothetical protein
MLNHIAPRIQAARLTMLASHLRAALALISLIALVLGGSAGGHWD